MAKNNELEFSTTAGSNLDIGGLGIDEGMPPSRANDAIRYLMKTRADAVTRHVAKVAGSYTAVKADHAQFWRCTGAVTLNLTAAATLTDGWQLFVRANGGAVTIDPSGTETVDGALTASLVDGMTATIICTGSEFFLIDQGFVGNPTPTGAILDYAGTTAPSGFLFCYGQSLVRADYVALFTAIGTTYGAADGTHFNVPDLRGRALVGKDDMGGSSANRLTALTGGIDGDTLGAVGGAEGHVLLTAQLPSHTHSFAATSSTVSADHSHTYSGSTGTESADHTHVNAYSNGGPGPWTGSVTAGSIASYTYGNIPSSGRSAAHTHAFSGTTSGISANHTHTVSGTTGGAGSDTTHNNVQPSIVINKIIKT